MRRPPTRWPWLVLSLALAAPLLAGCGGGGSTCSGSPQQVVASAAWQAYGPAEWSSCALEVRAPALGSDERLALLLVNAGGDDHGTATLSVSGAAVNLEAPDAAPLLRMAAAEPASRRDDRAAPALQQASLSRWLAGADGAGARRARGAVRAATALQPSRTFCVYALPSFTSWTRMEATLEHESAHAAYYVTKDVRAGLLNLVATTRRDFWTTLDSYYEGTVSAQNPSGARNILGAIGSSFGDTTDYDGNGKMIFLFTDLSAKDPKSGRATSFVAGYFDPNDIQVLDSTPGCTASGSAQGSNAADMLYLMDPVTYSTLGYAVDTVIDSELPAVMAHELQHDALFNARCLANGVRARCAASGDGKATGDLWLNEGLSMVAEDVAGFGLNTASGRQRVGAYLSCLDSGHTCHETASMTAWPTRGDPYGNYGAVHAFLRWHLDQQLKVSPAAGQAFLRSLVGATVEARSELAAASGLSFAEGSARFASATLFSGWPADPAPAWAFADGTAWSPLHARVAWPSYHFVGSGPIDAVLRIDGWWAYQTGSGSGADAVLSVTSGATTRPTLVVARVKGVLGTP